MIPVANRSSSTGSAAVELLAVLPLCALLALAGCQFVYAGYAQWQLHEAARDAARESYVVGGRRDDQAARRSAERVARDALGGLSSAMRVRQPRRGDVRVTLRLPLLGPFAALRGGGLRLAARARFGG